MQQMTYIEDVYMCYVSLPHGALGRTVLAVFPEYYMTPVQTSGAVFTL